MERARKTILNNQQSSGLYNLKLLILSDHRVPQSLYIQNTKARYFWYTDHIELSF